MTNGVVQELLLSVAHGRLDRGGYAALQVADIAREAGVATGTVYRHFPSKAELVAAAFRRAVDPEVAALRAAAAPGAPALDRVGAAVEAWVRRAFAAPKRAYALLAEPVGPEVDRLRHEYRDAFAGVFADALRDGVAAGEVDCDDPELVAAAMVGALNEALLGSLACRRPMEAEAVVATLRRFMLSAVTPRRDRVHA